MYLLVLFGIFIYWEGMAWHVQNGPFRVLCGKKVRQLEKKSTPAVLVVLVTNYSYVLLIHVILVNIVFLLVMNIDIGVNSFYSCEY